MARYNVTWIVTQAALEIARLTSVAAAMDVPGSGVTRDEVQLRLDIVVSQIRLLDSGEAGAFVRNDRELQTLADRLRAVVAEADKINGNLAQFDTSRQLLALLLPLNAELPRIASEAYLEGNRVVSQHIERLSYFHWIFSTILMALIACGLALIGALVWHNRLLHRAYEYVGALVTHLQRSSAQLSAAHDEARRAVEEVNQQNRALRERDATLDTQNARFDAALNNMSQALCMVDAEKRLIVCNFRFLTLFQLAPGMVKPGGIVRDLFQVMAEIGPYGRKTIEAVWAEATGFGCRAEVCDVLLRGEQRQGAGGLSSANVRWRVGGHL